MAYSSIPNIALIGIVCALPENVVHNSAENSGFSELEVEKIIKMTGVHSRYVAPADCLVSDLSYAACQKLMSETGWTPEDIDILIVVTQTGDHTIPGTSFFLHKRLGLLTHTLCLDFNIGCSGYVYGMMVMGSLLNAGAMRRGILVVGDTPTKYSGLNDRSTALLFGDASTASALEYDQQSNTPWHFVLGSDGRGSEHLIIPHGGYRHPFTLQSSVEARSVDGNIRAPVDLYMNGGEIFNFTIETVPKLLANLMEAAKIDRDDVDYFVLHQANEFIVRHLARKIGIPMDKVPLSLKEHGNTSCASIPVTLAHCLAGVLTSLPNAIVMAGFGAGYSWGAAYLHFNRPLRVASKILV